MLRFLLGFFVGRASVEADHIAPVPRADVFVDGEHLISISGGSAFVHDLWSSRHYPDHHHSDDGSSCEVV